MKTNYYVQYAGKEVLDSELVTTIKTQWKESGKLIGDIKTLDVYVKPEENKAYYAVNGEQAGEVSL